MLFMLSIHTSLKNVLKTQVLLMLFIFLGSIRGASLLYIDPEKDEQHEQH